MRKKSRIKVTLSYIYISSLLLLSIQAYGRTEQPEKDLEICKKFKIHFFIKHVTPKQERCSLILTKDQTQFFISSQEKEEPHLWTEKPKNASFTRSLVALTLFNIADYVTTLKALRYDTLQEANPVLRPIVNSPYIFTTLKLGTTVLTSMLLVKLHGRNPRLATVAGSLLSLGLSYIVFRNLDFIEEARILSGKHDRIFSLQPSAPSSQSSKKPF